MKVLVVDDEVNLRNTVVKFLEIEGHVAIGACDGLDGLEKVKNDNFDIIMTDLKMPRMTGLQFLEKLKEMGVRTPTIMMSAFGETKDAVNAMKLGAKDYIVKPLALDEVLLRIKNVHAMFCLENSINAIKKVQDDGFVGESVAIKNIKATVSKISNVSSNVLITGESGTGKEVLARYIHNNSPMANGPFMAINIAGVPDNLIESELFGYEKGAFTGATSRKLGLFEMAQGGTVFLDEIGDATPSLQVKLLRVLQEKKIMRLAGTAEIPINVRFISATNRNIENDVKEKRFREDLYFRLNVIKINLPPLNQRTGDIPLLAKYMIQKLNKKMSKSVKDLHPMALKKLEEHRFSGNVRELENLIERAMIFCTDEEYILPEMISFSAIAGPGAGAAGGMYGNMPQGGYPPQGGYGMPQGGYPPQGGYGMPQGGYPPQGYGAAQGWQNGMPAGAPGGYNAGYGANYGGYPNQGYPGMQGGYNPSHPGQPAGMNMNGMPGGVGMAGGMPAGAGVPGGSRPQSNADSGSLLLKDAEIENIKKALLKHEGNRSKAAEELGISRRTLLNKIEEYGL